MIKFKFKKSKKPLIILAGVLLGLFILGYFFVYRPYVRIKSKANAVMVSAREMKTTFAKNNIDLVEIKLNEVVTKYHDFENEAKTVYWASFIPYISDFKNGVEAGDYLLQAAQEGVVAVKPYADLIGFKKGEASFVERSAEDRLQTAILTLDKVLSKVDTISEDIRQAEIRIDRINPSRYPEKLGNTEVRSRIVNVKEQFKGVASLFVDAKPLLKSIPQLFGKDKEKTYLLLFQNTYEQRATGGFLTAYGIFKVRNGKMRIERSEDIYTLDETIPHPTAPREIITYHKGVSTFNIRDSNLSPDLPTSIALFNSLYEKSNRKVAYDGVITIDPKILIDMLTIFGDTEADGITFSARNDKRCDCPQVIYTLFDLVDRPTNYIKQNRKGILGDLMYQLFYKAIGFSPSKYWGTLAQQMFTNLQEKHVMLYFTDPALQKSIEKLNFAGRIQDYDGDYLSVVNVNFAGAKSNLYVGVNYISKTKTSGGALSRELEVDYRNPYPHSDCSLERGGLCLNATLRDWVRIYVPKGSKLVSFEGTLKKVQTYDELGKTVFEGYLEVTPLGQSKIFVKYTLPANITSNNYKLLFQKQPGTDGQNLKAEFDGRTIFNEILKTDQEIRVK